MTLNDGTQKNVAYHIQKIGWAFASLGNIWRSRFLTLRVKLCVFDACVKSILFCGSETWACTDLIGKKLQVFANKCLRRILRSGGPEQSQMRS